MIQKKHPQRQRNKMEEDNQKHWASYSQQRNSSSDSAAQSKIPSSTTAAALLSAVNARDKKSDKHVRFLNRHDLQEENSSSSSSAVMPYFQLPTMAANAKTKSSDKLSVYDASDEDEHSLGEGSANDDVFGNRNSQQLNSLEEEDGQDEEDLFKSDEEEETTSPASETGAAVSDGEGNDDEELDENDTQFGRDVSELGDEVVSTQMTGISLNQTQREGLKQVCEKYKQIYTSESEIIILLLSLNIAQSIPM